MSDTVHSWFKKLTHFLSREPHDANELLMLLRHAQQRQLIDRDALKMIEGVISVSDKKARDAMIPKTQMVVINADVTPQSVLPIMIQSQHSRFPVVSDDPDKIIGIILAKDLLAFATDATAEMQSIRQIMRPVVFVPESKKLDVLLKEFRLNRNHMAIVVDEYGNTSGLITIEDVLEEIVGNIEDEYDIEEKESFIKIMTDHVYQVNALTPIDDFNAYFHCQFNDPDVDTIGGLVLKKCGVVPKRQDKIQLDQFEMTVLKAGKRGIQLLQVRLA